MAMKLLEKKQGKYVQATFMIMVIMVVIGYALFTAPSNKQANEEEFLTGFSVVEDVQVNVDSSLKESTKTTEEILVEVNKDNPVDKNVYEFDNADVDTRNDIVGDAGLGSVTGFAVKKTSCKGTLTKGYLSGGNKDPQKVCVEWKDKDHVQSIIYYQPDLSKGWVIVPEGYVIATKADETLTLNVIRKDGLLVAALPTEYAPAKATFAVDIQNSFPQLFTSGTPAPSPSGVASEPAKPVVSPKKSSVGVVVEGTGGLRLLKLAQDKQGTTENTEAITGDQLNNNQYRTMTGPKGPDGKSINIRQHKSTTGEIYYTDKNNFLLPDGLVVEMETTGDKKIYRKYNSAGATFENVDVGSYNLQKDNSEYVSKYHNYQKSVQFALVKNSLDPTGQFPGHYVVTDSGNKGKFAFVDDQIWSEGTIYELKYNPNEGTYEQVKCETCDVEEEDGQYYVVKGKEKFKVGDKDPFDLAETALDGCVEKIADDTKNNEGEECGFVKDQLKAGYRIYSEKFRSEVGKLFGFAVEQADWYQKAKRVPTLMCAAGYNIRTQDGIPVTTQWVDNPPSYWGMDVKAITDFNVLRDADPFSNIYVYKLFAGKREEVTPTLYRYSFSMSLAGAMVYEVYLINSCTRDRSDDIQGGFIYQGSLGANGVDRQHFATDQLIFDCNKGACRFNYACVDMFLSQDSTDPDGRLCMPLDGGLHGSKFETATEEDSNGGSNAGTLSATDCSDTEEIQNKALPVHTICDIYDDPRSKGLQGCQ